MKLIKTALVGGLVVGLGFFAAYKINYFSKAESKERVIQKIIDSAGAISESCGQSVASLTRFEQTEKADESQSMKILWGQRSAGIFSQMDSKSDVKSVRGCVATTSRTAENVRCSQHSFVDGKNSQVIAHQCLEKIQQVEKVDFSRSAVQGE